MLAWLCWGWNGSDFSVSQLRIPLQHDFQIVTHVGVRTIPNGNAGILCRRLKDGLYDIGGSAGNGWHGLMRMCLHFQGGIDVDDMQGVGALSGLLKPSRIGECFGGFSKREPMSRSETR